MVAAYEPRGGYADPTATALGFLGAARRLGTRFERRRVTGVSERGGRVAGVDTHAAVFGRIQSRVLRRREGFSLHTAQELSSSSFEISAGGRALRIEDVFAGFGERDRLGIVVRSPCGAVGASAMILATVTAFYDIQRERAEDFFVYPDYFLFHVGGPLGNHKMLDIFPSHKEVVVDDDAEEILRAINDRAVTRLLTEDSEPAEPDLRPETLASARILTALAYSPGGRVEGADLGVAGNEVTEHYVSAVLDQSDEVETGVRNDIRAGRKGLFENGRPFETYRRLTIDGALTRLASPDDVVDAAGGSHEAGP